MQRYQVYDIVEEECEEQRGRPFSGKNRFGDATVIRRRGSVMPSASATGSGGAGYQTTNNNQASTINRSRETYQK